MMRESVRAQSRPPHRVSTVPPEAMRDGPMNVQVTTPSGARIMRGTTSGQPRSARQTGSHMSHNHSVSQNHVTPRKVSRHQTPKTPGSAAKFALDMLEDSDSSEDELEEKDMRSFFRRPARNQQQHPQQSHSSYQRAQTAVPESRHVGNFLNRANTPKFLQRQPKFEPYAVKQPPQLQSPIWASGADRRIPGSVSNSRSTFKPLDDYRIQQERQGRSESIAPRDVQAEHRDRSRSVASPRVEVGQRARSRSVVPLDIRDASAQDDIVLMVRNLHF